jgi:CRISPR/Cas system-associated exonuclease Cas4 (RecB family)
VPEELLAAPRRTRLLRAGDCAGYRQHLIDLTRELTPDTAAATFVLVPTAAAAEQLRRTLQERLGESTRSWWPAIGSRTDLYDDLASRLGDGPRRLSAVEREAMLAACAREAEEAGHPAPFHLRPALVAEMIALYDHIRRLGRTVDDFDRLLTGELAPAAEADRGASQLLEQTRFLSAAFRRYESRVAATGAVDEHGLRVRIIASSSATPLRQLAIAVGDRPFDADGFWPADVTLFTTLIGLERLDVLATEGALEAGFLDRVRHRFVEIDEGQSATANPPPALVIPDSKDGTPVFSYRDREDELEGVARRLKHAAAGGDALDRTGLVVARPLPYLYLAREVFASAGIAFEALDTLPLAAEPFAAAVDVVVECAAANFTRRALLALLRSPHFRFETDGIELDRSAIGRLDAVMAADRYLGGLDRLAALVESLGGTERSLAAFALSIASELAPLLETRPLAEQADLIRQFLERHDRPHPFDSLRSSDRSALRDHVQDRRRRARAAVMSALEGLSTAFRRHDPDAAGSVGELSGAIRRWLGAQTFALEGRKGGVRILDAPAARFADLDDVQIMGLVEGEWPERPRRNIFYPRALIGQLEPSRPERVDLNAERDHVRSARAAFRDLLGLARRHTRLSTFALESDAVVEPSSFIDDLPSLALPLERESQGENIRAFAYERLIDDPAGAGLPWALVRSHNAEREPARFQGQAGEWTLPRVSVSRLERYLKCPFQFYVSNVLQVAEEPEDENSRSPLERGRFLHELFETFFHEWQARGRGRITSREMAEARGLFEEIAEPALRSLSPAEAGLERARLFGSAVGSGIADRVFAMEAERGIEIRERLMEYELDGEFTFVGEDGDRKAVRLRAKIDRVDLLGDGTFRLIDYKTKYVPDRRTALQLPVYSACVRTTLSQQHGRDIAASEAMYLSFEGPQGVVPLEQHGKEFEDLLAAAGHRLVAALNDIARGHYPPVPETKNLCTMCRFTAVCRTPGGIDE